MTDKTIRLKYFLLLIVGGLTALLLLAMFNKTLDLLQPTNRAMPVTFILTPTPPGNFPLIIIPAPVFQLIVSIVIFLPRSKTFNI